MLGALGVLCVLCVLWPRCELCANCVAVCILCAAGVCLLCACTVRKCGCMGGARCVCAPMRGTQALSVGPPLRPPAPSVQTLQGEVEERTRSQQEADALLAQVQAAHEESVAAASAAHAAEVRRLTAELAEGRQAFAAAAARAVDKEAELQVRAWIVRANLLRGACLCVCTQDLVFCNAKCTWAPTRFICLVQPTPHTPGVSVRPPSPSC